MNRACHKHLTDLVSILPLPLYLQVQPYNHQQSTLLPILSPLPNHQQLSPLLNHQQLSPLLNHQQLSPLLNHQQLSPLFNHQQQLSLQPCHNVEGASPLPLEYFRLPTGLSPTLPTLTVSGRLSFQSPAKLHDSHLLQPLALLEILPATEITLRS